MTFEQWFEDRYTEDDLVMSWQEGCYDLDSIQCMMGEAFEAGHDACIDGLIERSDSSEWVQWRVEDLVECKYENTSS